MEHTCNARCIPILIEKPHVPHALIWFVSAVRRFLAEPKPPDDFWKELQVYIEEKGLHQEQDHNINEARPNTAKKLQPLNWRTKKEQALLFVLTPRESIIFIFL